MKTYLLYSFVILFVCFHVCTPDARGDYIYQVYVDTSSLQGTSGVLDFQLNPQVIGVQSLTATISGFSSVNGTLGSILTPTFGQVSGQLPNNITLVNSSDINDISQYIKYGLTLQFVVSLSGNAVQNPTNGVGGSAFLFSLLDSNLNPLLTSDPGGTLAGISVFSDGSTDVSTFPPNDSSPPLVTVTPLVSVPEPTSMIPLGIGMVTLAGYRRYCRRSSSE